MPARLRLALDPQTRQGLAEPLHSQAEPGNEIDHFILAKLKEKGIKPSPAADNRDSCAAYRST